MDIITYAQQHSLPVLGPLSDFPEYFAVHALTSKHLPNSKFLLSSDQLGRRSLTSETDALLETTHYVFFSVGKGCLQTAGSWGLVYDPFVLIKAAGANLVRNDLLYELDKTSILQDFCQTHRSTVNQIVGSDNAPFWDYVDSKLSLLIADQANPNHYEAALIFETILKRLPTSLTSELKQQILSQVVEPNTVTSDIGTKVRELFAEKQSFLNSFSDQLTEEIMPEIRVSHQHAIGQGLIAVYSSAEGQ